MDDATNNIEINKYELARKQRKKTPKTVGGLATKMNENGAIQCNGG